MHPVTAIPLVVVVVHVEDDVSELRPPTSILFIPKAIHEYGESRWNDIDRGKLKNSKKNLPSVHHKSHMD
jgi:hypothetical protein